MKKAACAAFFVVLKHCVRSATERAATTTTAPTTTAAAVTTTATATALAATASRQAVDAGACRVGLATGVVAAARLIAARSKLIRHQGVDVARQFVAIATWATLAAASLSFSADGLGPAAALSRAGFEQLGALLGAFSALGVSACLPSRADLSVGPVALTYARLATQQLVPLAVGAPAATLTIAPGPTYTYSTAGMSAGACSLPPSIYASVAVTGAAPGAAPAAVAMGTCSRMAVTLS
jgi:hypothetical protein